VEAFNSLQRSTRHHYAKEQHMRSNSGGGKSSNNTGNPTLEEHQAEKGVSGNAIRGEKKVDAGPSRTSQRKHQNS
jgi:hypothetical protein